jgi:hypothetical protein
LRAQREGVVSGVPVYQRTQKELSMTMVVKSPLVEPMFSRCFIGGARDLEQYRQEILDGILDSEIERGNWDYTYHSRMNEQMDFIVAELQRNPESRRAVIDVRTGRADIQKMQPGLPSAYSIFHTRRETALQGAVSLQRRAQGLVYERIRVNHAAKTLCRPARSRNRIIYAQGKQLPCL